MTKPEVPTIGLEIAELLFKEQLVSIWTYYSAVDYDKRKSDLLSEVASLIDNHSKIKDLQYRVERLQRDLTDPPLDVQERVLEKLGLRPDQPPRSPEDDIDESVTPEMLKAVAHVPKHKLRGELAGANDEIEKISSMLDKYEGEPEGTTSMEVTSDRIAQLLSAVKQLEKENKRLNEAGTGFMLKFEQLEKDKARLRRAAYDLLEALANKDSWGREVDALQSACGAAMGQQGNMKHTEFLDYEDLPPK